MTDPSSESWTMRSRPDLIAKSETIISVAFPNVALSSQPMVAEVCNASCSVTYPRRSASGQRASSAATNVMVPSHRSQSEATASGVHRRSMLRRVPKKTSLHDERRYAGQGCSAAELARAGVDGSSTDNGARLRSESGPARRIGVHVQDVGRKMFSIHMNGLRCLLYRSVRILILVKCVCRVFRFVIPYRR